MPGIKTVLKNCLAGRCLPLLGPCNTVFIFFALGKDFIKLKVEGKTLRTFRACKQIRSKGNIKHCIQILVDSDTDIWA